MCEISRIYDILHTNETGVIAPFKSDYQTMTKEEIKACMMLAYEAGKRAWQVELEEFMENQQFWKSALEAISARTTWMPTQDSSTGREVTYTLRSDKRREWVRISANKYLDDAVNLLFKLYNVDG